MRTRQKLTAIGALALATTAVGGGAIVTSHAMADAPTPGKGTVTVISMTDGSDGAIRCVYDDVDLPVPQVRSVLGTDVGGQVAAVPAGAGDAFDVIAGQGPIDANGDPIAGAVIISSGTAMLPDGQVPGVPPDFTFNEATTGATSVGGDSETALPPLPAGAVVIDAANARPGTTEECAAMKPTNVLPPLLTAP
jgi:hypothetical protein